MRIACSASYWKYHQRYNEEDGRPFDPEYFKNAPVVFLKIERDASGGSVFWVIEKKRAGKERGRVMFDGVIGNSTLAPGYEPPENAVPVTLDEFHEMTGAE